MQSNVLLQHHCVVRPLITVKTQKKIPQKIREKIRLTERVPSRSYQQSLQSHTDQEHDANRAGKQSHQTVSHQRPGSGRRVPHSSYSNSCPNKGDDGYRGYRRWSLVCTVGIMGNFFQTYECDMLTRKASQAWVNEGRSGKAQLRVRKRKWMSESLLQRWTMVAACGHRRGVQRTAGEGERTVPCCL